jgi:hypothetical protein
MTSKPARTHDELDRLGPERPILDRALGGPAFSIDPLACVAAAQTLTKLRPESEQVQTRNLLSVELMFRLALAAICHQINWDFLSERLRLVARTNGLSTDKLKSVTARDIEKWLEGYHRPERTRPKERAALLRDVGLTIQQHFQGKPENLLKGSGRRLHGPDGFLERMDRFRAFREDPLRKKTNVLVHEIVRDRIANFDDSAQIAPAVDYHIMRLYLRTGRVFPLHRVTVDVLKQDSSPRPRLVKLLRKAVSDALSLTAMYANMTVPEVNSLEWQIGREICDRARPNCTGENLTLAERFGIVGDGCPFNSSCRAFSDTEWRKLREPDLRKSFY